ncbi:MAG: efflux RND transporter periplasmic adaptor subunit [Flavobacteriales bacterium]
MKAKTIYILLAVVLLSGTALYFILRKPKAAQETSAETPDTESAESGEREVELSEAQYKTSGIQLGSFEKKNLSEVIHANGYTKLPPQNQADVSVFTGGLIRSIDVIEGEYVRKGQRLATLESPEFTRLQEAYFTSKSSLEFLTSELERQKVLNQEQVNARKTYEKTKADYETEKARFASLGKQLELMHIPVSEQSVSAVSVTAPISGYITAVNVKIGTNAEPGKPLFSIVDNSQMHVDLLVYEKDLYKVKEGQTVRFVLTNQDHSEIRGRIFSVGKAFENETKSVAVHADIINDRQMLIPGMYVNALIDVGVNEVPALPSEAIVKADGREFIFVLEEEEDTDAHEEGGEAHEHGIHFRRVEVKSGVTQLGYTGVTPLQELPAKVKIVKSGAYYLQSHLVKTESGGGHAH